MEIHIIIRGVKEYLTNETLEQLKKVAGVRIIYRGSEIDLEFEDSELASSILREKCNILLKLS